MAAPSQATPETHYFGSARIQSTADDIQILVARRPTLRFLVGPVVVVLIFWYVPKYHDIVFSPEFPLMRIYFGLLLGGLFFKGMWDAISRDIISVNEQFFSINKGIFALGWTRRYPLREVGNLRWRPAVGQGRSYVPSRILFDYQYMPRQCAAGIFEDDANRIIAILKQRFPEMGASAQVSVC
jgi:hypothetical protein